MKEHQLEQNTYCVPKDKQQCIEILTLADEQGLIDGYGYTRDVRCNETEWPSKAGAINKAVSFSGRYVWAFADYRDTEIPVAEFIARLKGEWGEPNTEVGNLKEQVANLQRQLDNLRQLLKDKGIITKY